MGLFDNFKKNEDNQEKSKTEEIIQQRAALKNKIAQNLKNAGFSASEVNEVLDILKACEEEIQIIKDSLIGTNINNPDCMEITDSAMRRIHNLEIRAGEDMRNKIAEIQARRLNQ